jgi:1,2-diacylglycerol 3-alpha-glucosyltransferase
MKIGFISTWFERGAAYVTKAYIDALKNKHDIYVYARGGESYAKSDPNWDLPYVTWGLMLNGTKINYSHFKNWIIKNKIEVLFFNEQREIEIVAKIKIEFPCIKIGSYIDYYKEDSLDDFFVYDFLICNTKRHYSVFKKYPQCYYVPWGTNIELFKPQNKNNDLITFFHSAGMSKRKGTDLLLKAFIDGEMYKKSKLIIHSQLNFKKYFGYDIEECLRYNVEIIERTVSAPGLYHLGDVYVYPTTLDGLGLTIYEALSCGLPVITTDNAPMNEIITSEVGCLVEVERYYSRNDGYYWPLSICNKESLIKQMHYFIENSNNINYFKNQARVYAVNQLNWERRYSEINEIFSTSKILKNYLDLHEYIKKMKLFRVSELKGAFINILPDTIVNLINRIY